MHERLSLTDENKKAPAEHKKGKYSSLQQLRHKARHECLRTVQCSQKKESFFAERLALTIICRVGHDTEIFTEVLISSPGHTSRIEAILDVRQPSYGQGHIPFQPLTSAAGIAALSNITVLINGECFWIIIGLNERVVYLKTVP